MGSCDGHARGEGNLHSVPPMGHLAHLEALHPKRSFPWNHPVSWGPSLPADDVDPGHPRLIIVVAEERGHHAVDSRCSPLAQNGPRGHRFCIEVTRQIRRRSLTDPFLGTV